MAFVHGTLMRGVFECLCTTAPISRPTIATGGPSTLSVCVCVRRSHMPCVPVDIHILYINMPRYAQCILYTIERIYIFTQGPYIMYVCMCTQPITTLSTLQTQKTHHRGWDHFPSLEKCASGRGHVLCLFLSFFCRGSGDLCQLLHLRGDQCTRHLMRESCRFHWFLGYRGNR